MENSSLNIKTSSYIYRKENKVIESIDKISDEEHELLFKIRMSFGKKKYLEIIRNKYELDENDNLVNPNPCFFLLKPSKQDQKMNRYKLNPGEQVKIGRITMRIRDIKFNNKSVKNSLNELLPKSQVKNDKLKENEKKLKKAHNNNTRLETTDKLINDNKNNKINLKKMTQRDIFSKLEKMKRVCRICYLEEEENNQENPLVQPCTCTGSVKFIHLDCLRKWVSTRSCVKIDASEDCSIFLIKPVECELCKSKFPDYIKYENRLLPVIDFSQEFENFLTMESLTLDRQNNKFIYVINLNKERQIKIGRGHEARVILSDISVSRIHCIMTVEKNQVFIEDNESKFGTLILVQCPTIKLTENLPLYIQVGRTFFECKLTKPFKLFNCCEVEEKNNIYYYYNQNAKFIKDHLGMVVKPDLSEIDSDEAKDNMINNTCEQKSKLDIINQYKISNINERILINEGDKMSDNEYFLLKHKKKKKIIKKEMIYDSDKDKNEENKVDEDHNENENEDNNNNNGNNGNVDDDFDDENNESNDTASLNDESSDNSQDSKDDNNNKKDGNENNEENNNLINNNENEEVINNNDNNNNLIS